MAIIKCKMCGGDLELVDGSSVCECEYCGTKQTVPTADNDKKLTLFARANRLRAANEFDKAAGVYENLVADFPEEAEAYWGLVLCRYGIEYVDDPATGKKIPTCHRSSFDSILEDEDFEQACENADAIARRVYRDEAKAIENIRRGILEISGREEPYDIFICYKETDDSGERTIDSVLAQDVYDALTEKGYRVFFSRVSLEDKLGTEYEPYIFAALNSAKVMLVFGTDYEHFNAVWVKNEWSRFLALMAGGQKKVLIPCYKDVDAYDMPKEFQRLQAQDMGKVGAVQDLLRGIGKIMPRDGAEETAPTQPVVQQTVIQGGGPNADSLLRRGEMALEDAHWEEAKDFFNRVLDMTPESAEAFLGLAMAEANSRTRADFQSAYTEADCGWRNNSYLKRVRQFGASDLLDWFKLMDSEARENDDSARLAREKAMEAEAILQARIETQRKHVTAASVLIATGDNHTVGLHASGTVVSAGVANVVYIQIIQKWNDIIGVAAGSSHTVGLKANGTVVASGSDKSGQCHVDDWKDIVAIAAGSDYTLGLKSDGTLVARGGNRWGQCDILAWNDIVAIAAGQDHSVGINTNGTVIATGSNKYNQCSVAEWTRIVSVDAGAYHTVGLEYDGTVLAVGNNKLGQCNVSEWKGVVAIVAGAYHTVGLKYDGTVLAVGNNEFGQCNVGEWDNVVAVAAGEATTVGLKADGTVVATGRNEKGGCDVSEWKLFDNIDTLKEERDAYKNEVLEEQQQFENGIKQNRINYLNTRRKRLEEELENMSGMFAERKRKQIVKQIMQIDKEIRSIRCADQ